MRAAVAAVRATWTDYYTATEAVRAAAAGGSVRRGLRGGARRPEAALRGFRTAMDASTGRLTLCLRRLVAQPRTACSTNASPKRQKRQHGGQEEPGGLSA